MNIKMNIFRECANISARIDSKDPLYDNIYFKVLQEVSFFLEERKDQGEIERYRASIDLPTFSIVVTIWLDGKPHMGMIPVDDENSPWRSWGPESRWDEFERAKSVLETTSRNEEWFAQHSEIECPGCYNKPRYLKYDTTSCLGRPGCKHPEAKYRKFDDYANFVLSYDKGVNLHDIPSSELPSERLRGIQQQLAQLTEQLENEVARIRQELDRGIVEKRVSAVSLPTSCTG